MVAVVVVVVVLDSYLQIVAFVDMHNQPQFVVVAVVASNIVVVVVCGVVIRHAFLKTFNTFCYISH